MPVCSAQVNIHTRHTKQLIRTCQLSSWALCITTSWIPTMYEFFCLWESTCAFRHFEHSKFSFPSYNLAHFGVPYLCSLNLGKSSNQDLQKEMIKQSGTILPCKTLILVTWLCNYGCFTKCDSVHFANGSEQCFELHILRNQVAQLLLTFKLYLVSYEDTLTPHSVS